MTARTDLTVYSSASPAAVLVLAHGAGAGQHSPFMTGVARGFAARGLTCATFDFPYITARRRVPDAPAVLEACWHGAIASARAELPPAPLFIGGKSMGGRIASQVAAAGDPGIAGLVFLGYPLHPPGRPGQRRDAHLPQIAAPMLFVQGTRDTFGTSDEIAALLPRLSRADIHVVEGGDHSFKVSRSGTSAGAILDSIMDAVVAWIRRTGAGRA